MKLETSVITGLSLFDTETNRVWTYRGDSEDVKTALQCIRSFESCWQEDTIFVSWNTLGWILAFIFCIVSIGVGVWMGY